ncbi:MAG TPA: RNA polymerase sigma factor [Polyangiaceae bacterium]|nr:RNA polymerase sigma factor [Polyangiaceae bacterium]
MDGQIGRGDAERGADEVVGDLMRDVYVTIERAARRILRNDDDAKDVAQEVFLRAICKARAEGFVAPPAWLHRVTTNLCLNRLRDERRRRELLFDSTPETSRPSPPEATVLLRQLLHEMPDTFECAVRRHYLDEESHQEIAVGMGVSRRTVGNRLAAFQTWLAATE